jgi:hypothetical protein
MPARAIIVWTAAALLALASIAQAMVALPPSGRVLPIERIWPGHPKLATERAMAALGRAAAQPTGNFDGPIGDLRRVATRSPLAPEPYLVAGTIADTMGNGGRAERLLLAARLRDPRSSAARYLLALRFLDEGDVGRALEEMTALGRLMPSAKGAMIDAMAAYAKQAGAAARLRELVRGDPEVEQRLLATLAQDAANADLILAIAGPRQNARPGQSWPSELVAALVRSGQPARARQVWARLSGETPAVGVFHPDFRPSAAPPPFNWSLATAAGAALIEARAAGGLDIVYYGRDSAVLASQRLVLPPGRYRLEGDHSATQGTGALSWVVSCDGAAQPLLSLPLAVDGAEQAEFAVPGAACGSQLLELRATPGEVASQLSLAIRRVNVTPVRP